MGSRGGIALIKYRVRGPRLLHERVLAAHVVDDVWVIVTPDLEMYVENYADLNAHEEVRYRPRYGILPLGLPADTPIYEFDPRPTERMVRDWMVEARPLAEQELRRLRRPAPPADRIPPLAEELMPAAGALVVADPLAAPPAPLAAAAAAAADPGLAALQAALRRPASPGATTPRGGGDARTLPVRFDVTGAQYREFREAVMLCQESRVDNFLVDGPRTAGWVMRFMMENGSTPLGRHAKFKADARLSVTDPGVVAHEHLCKLLQTALTVDQLDGTNCATVELICREIQLIEERYADRLRTHDPLHEDGEYFMRTSLGTGNVCMCPALRTWIGDQMRGDASVMKERRKAREERQLLRAPPDGSHGKQKKGKGKGEPEG